MSISFKEIKTLIRSRKARDEQGLFVTEGRKLFEEAPKDGVVEVVATKAFASEHAALFEALPGEVSVVDDVSEDRFAGLCDTKTPQGVLVVQRQRHFEVEDLLTHPAPLFLLLENLQDPGNAGTILRTAEAAGVDAVFMTEDTVDYYHPKTIRATMGAIYRVPRVVIKDAGELLDAMHGQGITSYAAHLAGSVPYTEGTYTGGSVFLIGNEGHGLTDALTAKALRRIRIPMRGQAESLNAAMAAGILMYEARRQRDAAGAEK